MGLEPQAARVAPSDAPQDAEMQTRAPGTPVGALWSSPAAGPRLAPQASAASADMHTQATEPPLSHLLAQSGAGEGGVEALMVLWTLIL